ncbi:MAG TPA: hypothetical protein VHP83_09940 [Aggregatilineaceae bacterium]|nr:hypothetical protein [Aggregatilineaceae bacterium]
MKRIFIIALFLAFALLPNHASSVQAYADVSSFSADCGSFSVTGTTNAPYIVVEVYNPATDKDLFFQSFKVTGGNFTLGAFFPSVPEGTYLEGWVWGSPTSDPEDWDGESYMYAEGYCDNGFPGPTIPATFTNHYITCDTMVYSSAGGGAVADTWIHNGQTWFVGPTPAVAPDGKSWTEIFVGGVSTGWIPTSCVGVPVS